MSKRPVELLLNDMLDSIDRIEQYTKGMSFEAFSNDQKTIDAVARNLQLIGEASSRLPDDFKEEHFGLEWHKIIGLRHRIVHDYFGIDIEIIWQILRKDLPALHANLPRI